MSGANLPADESEISDKYCWNGDEEMASEQEFLAEITKQTRHLVAADADAQRFGKALTNQWDKERQKQIAQLHTESHEALTQIQEKYGAQVEHLQHEFVEQELKWGLSASDWDSEAWESYKPNSSGNTVPYLTRIGSIQETGKWSKVKVPAMVPIISQGHLLIEASGGAKDLAVEAVQSVMLRLLATMPVGKLQFMLIDPVGLGQNVSGFMRFDQYSEDLIGKRAWTEPNHIEQRLADISEHMETVIQKYLRNQYENMEQYNAEAGEVAEPYRVIVVMNFPVNFTESAARRLVSIASNGPRCGVHVLVTVDAEQPVPHGFRLAELQRFSNVITWTKDRFVWQMPFFTEYQLILDRVPKGELFDLMVDQTGLVVKENAGQVKVPFEQIVGIGEELWKGSTIDGIQVPIGRAGARRVQVFSLGTGTAHHALVGGQTGAGKTNLFQVLITGMMLRYSPDELHLYLIDFRKGVEFKRYAEHHLPHVRVLAIESEREFGLSVLQALNDEMTRRGELFRQVNMSNIADYRRVTEAPLPRIVLIVDEFQEFFAEDDVLASDVAGLLQRLVLQGRGFGIHVILGTQSLAGKSSSIRSFIGQLAIRIAVKCQEADSRMILSDDNPVAHLLRRRGEAIYNAENGLYAGNQLFQVAWMDREVHEGYLSRLADYVTDSNYRNPYRQVVFESMEPASITDNMQLQDLLANNNHEGNRTDTLAWLGEPVSVRQSTAAVFRRQSASNLLIVGQDQRRVVGCLMVACIGLAAQHEHDGVQFYHVDMTADNPDWQTNVQQLSGILGRPTLFGHRRELGMIINEVYEIVQAKHEQGSTQTSDHKTYYLVLWGLQRARELRIDDSIGMVRLDEHESETLSLTQKFSSILADGPDVGVHVCLWCDTMANLFRSVSRKDMSEFGMRVAFQMSAEDSSNLIDSPAASKLGAYRALLLDEYTGHLVKFRPYDLPTSEWLAYARQQLQS